MLGAPKEQRSLLGEILDWMLAPLLLLWPMSIALTWPVAQGIANRPYDHELGERALAIARTLAIRRGGSARSLDLAHAPAVARSSDPLPAQPEDDAPEGGERSYVQVLGLRGELLLGDPDLPVPSAGEAPLGELQYRDEKLHNGPVRVAYVWVAVGAEDGESPPLVQVAQTLHKRSRLATEIIKGVILPQFLILPLAVLLVWLALARGLAPLGTLQRRIRDRDANDLSPIDEHDAPEEVAPLVGAINDLLSRLGRSIASQKHFLADAAHQLKTPLAGLRTQAELAQRQIDSGGDPGAVRRSLQQIARSSQRAAHMVNQLLAMARAEDTEQARRAQTFDLVRVATDAVQDLVPRAIDKRIDLGFDAPAGNAAVRLVGQPVLVRELVRNLVDNALQYTPAGGTVNVRIVPDPFGQVAVLVVEDSGPGIPAAERDLVFQPFYRALGTQVDGSGLGLAIVREVAQQHGAEVAVEDARDHVGPDAMPGARFTVRFALAPPPP